ncbi:MAG: ABC transporter permease [Lachnospiraceae bacterium]|nr:ABC transporter permease [Lachnospiraceae bacterium]
MLLRKMWRDLLKNKVQFFSIFIMSFLGIFVFSGLDSEVSGMDHYEGVYYENTNLYDICAQGMAFKNRHLSKVKYLKDVKEAELRFKTAGKAELSKEYDLQMLFIDDNKISRMILAEGIPYTPGASGVWVDINFMKKQGLSVGDMLNMKLNGISFGQEIKGAVYHPEFVYYVKDVSAFMPDYGEYGFVVMDTGSYPLDDFYYNQMVIRSSVADNTGGLDKDEKNRLSRLMNEVKYVLDSDEVILTDKDADLSYQTFRAEIEQHASMVYIFPPIFLAIALLGIITTMTRMTAKQRVQIGTLKALGFSKRTITVHYASYAFFLSLFGGVLGAVLGYFTIAKYILGMMNTSYILPKVNTVFSFKSYAAVLISVIISSLVSIMACRKELSPAPADTLRPASPKNLKHSLIERSFLWKHIGFTIQWNLRDILRNKIRTIMGIIGVLGCSMLIFAACACLDTVEFITTWMYGELNTSRYSIIMNEGVSYGDTAEYAKKYKGQMVSTLGCEFEAGGIKKSGNITIPDRGNYLHYQDRQLKHIDLHEDGVAMSYRMSVLLGIKEGDMFSWHIIGDDKWHTDRVSDIYRNPSVQGITMSRKRYESYEYSFCPQTIYTNMDPVKELKDDDNIAGVQGLSEMMKAMDAMKEMMYAMVYIMITAAAILGIVVLYNLGVLSLVEKNREMATLKVLGFKSARIRSILQIQNVWVTLLGISCGIPFGIVVINILFGTMPESMDYVAKYSEKSFIICILGTFVLSYLVNRVLSGKVKTIDMVDALKGQE